MHSLHLESTNLVPGPLQRSQASISDSFWGSADINRCRTCLKALNILKHEFLANQILLRKSSGVQQQEVHRKGRCNAVNSQDPKFRIVQYAPVTPPSTLPKAQAHLRLQLHPCVADRQKRQMHNLCGSQMDLQSVWSYLVHSVHFDPEKKMSRKIAFSQCSSNGTSTYHCPTAAANALWAELAELASDQVIEGPSAPNFASMIRLEILLISSSLEAQVQLEMFWQTRYSEIPELDLKCLVDFVNFN